MRGTKRTFTSLVALCALALCALALCALALALSGCGSATSTNPLAVEVVGAPDSSWTSTGLPYGGHEADGKLMKLSYRGHSVAVPTTDPAWTKAAGVGPRDEAPTLELATAGATADAGIFQLTPPGQASEVWTLTSDGSWRKIGSGLAQLVLADVSGHLAAWVEGAGPHAENQQGATVAAYDTRSGKLIGELPGSEFPGTHLWVMAVNDDCVLVQAVQDSPEERWSRNYLWKPATQDLKEMTDTDPGDLVTVTDFDSATGNQVLLSFGQESRLVGPEGVTNIGDYGFGQFNSDATQVILEGFGSAKLLDVRTKKAIDLDLPISGTDDFFPAAFWWTADDRLAVIGAKANQSQQAWICLTSTGECSEMGTDYLWFASRENSSLGQFAYHDTPEGD